MHAGSGLFSCSIPVEHLAFASRLFAPKILDNLLHLSFQSIPRCEEAWRAEPPATRSGLYSYFLSSFLNGFRWHQPGLA